MGVVDGDGNEIPSVREDVLHVFHGGNGKHAGTLKFIEELFRNTPGRSTWTCEWNGGPWGPLSGNWDHQTIQPDGKLGFVLRLYDNIERPAGLRVVFNSRWGTINHLPYRPWFQRGDSISLFDSNFRTPGSPDGHTFRCSLVASPG